MYSIPAHGQAGRPNSSLDGQKSEVDENVSREVCEGKSVTSLMLNCQLVTSKSRGINFPFFLSGNTGTAPSVDRKQYFPFSRK